MTTITRERLLKIQQWRETYGPGSNVVLPAEEAEELARIALASLTAEPVAWIVHSRGGDQLTTDANYVANAEGMGGIHSTPVYAAPPAPTVTFYRDGIESAAAWVNKQREEYDNEHGRHDPDTGTFEFGNDAQRDYSATLEEIAEGIRSLHPNTAPPAPVVPDERAAFNAWNNDTDCPLAGLTVKQAAWLAWLKRSGTIKSFGNDEEFEPVSNRDELLPSIKHAPELDSVAKNAKLLPSKYPVIPDEVLSAIRKVARIRTDLNDFDGDRRGIADCLDEAEQELIVTINEHAAMLQTGNSPVTQDGWVACSERLPPEGYEEDGGAVCYLVWHKNEVDCGPQYSISNVFFLRKHWEKNFTHWMPLPAAPQQEVK